MLAVVTVLVLLFLFIPILLVILHSFNSGGSFSIWSGSDSTKWWGTLFRADETWAMIIRFAVILLVGVLGPKVVRRLTGKSNRHVDRWAGPVAFAVALIVNGMMTVVPRHLP